MRGDTECRVSRGRPIPLVIKASCRALPPIMGVPKACGMEETHRHQLIRLAPASYAEILAGEPIYLLRSRNFLRVYGKASAAYWGLGSEGRRVEVEVRIPGVAAAGGWHDHMTAVTAPNAPLKLTPMTRWIARAWEKY
jgi:hypothetical protein